jgi:hypothetical protein
MDTQQKPKAAYLAFMRAHVADLRASIASTLAEIADAEALIQAVEAGSVRAVVTGNGNGVVPTARPATKSGDWVTFLNIKRGEGLQMPEIVALWKAEKAEKKKAGKA